MQKYHIVKTAAEADYKLPKAYEKISKGYRVWSIVNRETGSVHQEFNLCELEPGGSIDTHLHTFEEAIYILEGELICATSDGTYAMTQGDYGFIQVATPHALRNEGKTTVRWAESLAPQPRLDSDDVYPVEELPKVSPITVDARDPRTRAFGHISDANMDPTKQSQNLLALSASMRTALLVYSGITVKMMIDSELGAQLATMFMVQYVPGGMASPHDHPLEEAYLILEGEVDSKFDGIHYLLKPGDVAWSGVGCIHEFKNNTNGIVRWLETATPQPSRRYSYRFLRDWKYFEEKLNKKDGSNG
jgi:quercetin dioxygenase-like cupin family protein